MKILKVNNKIYQLKFGLTELISLDEFSNTDEQERLYFEFYLALGSVLPRQAVIDFVDALDDPKKVIEEVYEDAGVRLDAPAASTVKEQVDELYQLAVGQLHISPQVFFSLSPHEIALIYKGYLQEKELEANLQLIALRRAKDNEAESINLFTNSYAPSTMTKRNETFAALGISGKEEK